MVHQGTHDLELSLILMCDTDMFKFYFYISLLKNKSIKMLVFINQSKFHLLWNFPWWDDHCRSVFSYPCFALFCQHNATLSIHFTSGLSTTTLHTWRRIFFLISSLHFHSMAKPLSEFYLGYSITWYSLYTHIPSHCISIIHTLKQILNPHTYIFACYD